MPVTVVVGGQFGSEGKGKVVALCALREEEPWVVRCGGPNSGHTVTLQERSLGLRQVPSGVVNPKARLALAAGCAVDVDVLLSEMSNLRLPRDRVVVDPRAVLVTAADRHREEAIVATIGSTGTGTGAALARRQARGSNVELAGDSHHLAQHVRVEPVAPLLHGHIDKGGSVLIEGTQGFGLSLLHGPSYPYCTSRDTTAAGFVMEVGLSPRQIDEVIMVIRTFPIRVGGNSGPLTDELTWEDIQRIAGEPHVRPEYTTVTNRLRRIGHFDTGLVRQACLYNRPTSLAVMGLDRLDFRCHSARNADQLTSKGLAFLHRLEEVTEVRVEFAGTGFGTFDVVEFPSKVSRWSSRHPCAAEAGHCGSTAESCVR